MVAEATEEKMESNEAVDGELEEEQHRHLCARRGGGLGGGGGGGCVGGPATCMLLIPKCTHDRGLPYRGQYASKQASSGGGSRSSTPLAGSCRTT